MNTKRNEKNQRWIQSKKIHPLKYTDYRIMQFIFRSVFTFLVGFNNFTAQRIHKTHQQSPTMANISRRFQFFNGLGARWIQDPKLKLYMHIMFQTHHPVFIQLSHSVGFYSILFYYYYLFGLYFSRASFVARLSYLRLSDALSIILHYIDIVLIFVICIWSAVVHHRQRRMFTTINGIQGFHLTAGNENHQSPV